MKAPRHRKMTAPERDGFVPDCLVRAGAWIGPTSEAERIALKLMKPKAIRVPKRITVREFSWQKTEK